MSLLVSCLSLPASPESKRVLSVDTSTILVSSSKSRLERVVKSDQGPWVQYPPLMRCGVWPDAPRLRVHNMNCSGRSREPEIGFPRVSRFIQHSFGAWSPQSWTSSSFSRSPSSPANPLSRALSFTRASNLVTTLVNQASRIVDFWIQLGLHKPDASRCVIKLMLAAALHGALPKI